MPERQVDAELKSLCEIATAGFDDDVLALSEATLSRLMTALMTSDPGVVLDWCKTAAIADDMLQVPSGVYSGGNDHDSEYSFCFRDEGRDALITLTQEGLRKVASGKRTSVEFDYQ